MSDSPDPQTLSYESPHATLSGIGIGTIALQILGVYCLALALPIFSVLAAAVGFSGGGSLAGRGGWELLVSFTMPGLYIAMGIVLIRLAPRLSARLFGNVASGVMTGPITSPAGQYLQAIAFSVVGVLTMIDAAPRLVWLLWMVLMDRGSSEGYATMVEPSMQFLLGLALFLQSRGLSLLWHKMRTGGVADPQPETTPAPGPVHSDSDNA